MKVGCFYDQALDRDLPYEAFPAPVDIKSCTSTCAQKYFKYAGLQEGHRCFCGGSFGKHGPGQCNTLCDQSRNETCGGESSNSVFSTGFKVPGPPASVELVSKTSRSLYVRWSPPESQNGVITEYSIQVSVNFSYHPDYKRFPFKSLKFSNLTNTASINDLLPGTLYNVSVSAGSLEGFGPVAFKMLWTEIGKPNSPEPPKLLKKDQGLQVKLYPSQEHGGPITAYQVIVIDETNPTPFSSETLYSHDRAEQEGLTYWIAAELSPNYLESNRIFSIGDGRSYGAYQNYGPLSTNHDYHVSLAVVSTLHGVTKRSFAKVSHQQHKDKNRVVQFLNHDSESEDYKDYNHFIETFDGDKSEGDATSPLVIGLTVAIIITALILIGSVALFVYLRHSMGARLRRRRANNQELTSQAHLTPSIDLDNSGYLDNGYVNETMRTAEEYMESLKDKVWMIPKNFVELNHEVLGRGKFGSVMKGHVTLNGQIINCNSQVISNTILSPEEQKIMLKDLDINIRAGQHPNLICLIGICEEVETTQIIMDHAGPSLKQYLLDSRALLNYPEYAQKNSRFSTAREEVMIDVLAGVASGLDHLSRSNVSKLFTS